MIDNENSISTASVLALAKSMALKYGVVGIQDIRLNALANGIEFVLVTGDVVNVPFTASELPFNGTISGVTQNNIQDTIDNIYDILKRNMLLFSQTANKTNICDGTAQSIIGTGVGTLTIPANLLKTGDNIYIKFSGILTLANGTSTTLTIKLNDTTIYTQTAQINAELNNTPYEAYGDIIVDSVGTTGFVRIGGVRNIFAAQGFGTATTLAIRGNANIDTTIDNTLSVTYTAPTGATITNEIMILKKTSVKELF